MDFDDPKLRAVFFDVHSGLPREGPGNRASTARALALADPLPTGPRVLDIACGPGMQTLDLAGLLTTARIVAVDRHGPFVAEARRRAAAHGAAGRVTAVQGDMRALAFRPAGFDLLWCEGAAYVMGVAAALRAWRPLLRPGGRLALSEAVWLRPDPREAVRRRWAAAYPAMGDVAACRRLAGACGYRLLGDFVLPEEAWWSDYYGPMERRLARLARKYAGDGAAEAVLAECQAEIDDYRAHADDYGYAFLVMARDG